MKNIVYILLVGLLLSCSNDNVQESSLYDFGTISFEEPFRGIFNNSLVRKSMSIPPFKWLKPDTLSVQKTFILEFNEDALRSSASATLFFADSLCRPIDRVYFSTENGSCTNNQITIIADSLSKTLTVTCRIDPALGKRVIKGRVFVSCNEIDQVNSIPIQMDKVNITDWSVEHKYNIPWGLWTLWSLGLLLVALLVVGLVILICKISPLIIQSSAGAIQKAITFLYGLPNFLHKIIFKMLSKNMQKFLKETMPSKSNMKVGKVKASNVAQQRKLDEIRRITGKDLRYKNGEVDFTPVSAHQVKLPGSLDKCIPETLDPRSKVYKAQELAGNIMLESSEGRKKIARYVGKSQYKLTFDDYTAWKDDRLNIGRHNHNPLTPHETIDGKYIQWVPKKYHDAGNGWEGFSHSGGVSLLKNIRTYLSNS